MEPFWASVQAIDALSDECEAAQRAAADQRARGLQAAQQERDLAHQSAEQLCRLGERTLTDTKEALRQTGCADLLPARVRPAQVVSTATAEVLAGELDALQRRAVETSEELERHREASRERRRQEASDRERLADQGRREAAQEARRAWETQARRANAVSAVTAVCVLVISVIVGLVIGVPLLIAVAALVAAVVFLLVRVSLSPKGDPPAPA